MPSKKKLAHGLIEAARFAEGVANKQTILENIVNNLLDRTEALEKEVQSLRKHLESNNSCLNKKD